MDEKIKEIEQIPNNDNVFRQVPVMHLTKISKKKRIPNEANFKPDPDGLSVNWEKYCSSNRCYQLLGLTHNRKGEFINITSFKLIKLNVGDIRDINGINDIIHDPTPYRGVGKPQNDGHALIKYNDDAEIRLKLADYASDKLVEKPDFAQLENEIAQLKKRLA